MEYKAISIKADIGVFGLDKGIGRFDVSITERLNEIGKELGEGWELITMFSPALQGVHTAVFGRKVSKG